jgi:hypothetical protein
MSTSPSANFSPTFQIPTAGTDQFDVTMLDVALAALDTHTHEANKGLAVGRVTLASTQPTTTGALGQSAGRMTIGDGTAARYLGSYYLQRIVGDGVITSFDFQNIPAGYKNLEIIVSGRMSQAATEWPFYMTLNNDGGANYYSLATFTDGTNGVVVTTLLAQTSAYVGSLTGSTAPAGAAGAFRLLIPHYQQIEFNRRYTASGGHRLNNLAVGQVRTEADGEWTNTANVINRVTIFSGVNTIQATCAATLYAWM